jgi:hypothetical protein
MANQTKEYLLRKQSYVRDSILADPVDLTQFSTAGLTPDFVNMDGMSDYVNHNTMLFVLHLPTMFNVFKQDGPLIQGAIKNMLENHSVRIDGLNARIDVDAYETDFHGGGEKFQTDINITRQQSSISITFNDKRNRPIQKLLEFWIKCKAGDPNTKTPLISLYDKSLRYTELLPSMYSCVVAFVTPNETKTRVDKAWLTHHFWPKTAGENNGQKDITVKGVSNQLSIEWFGTSQFGYGVDELGQRLLDSLNRPALNSELHGLGITDIDPDVKAAVSGTLKMLDEQARDMHHSTYS